MRQKERAVGRQSSDRQKESKTKDDKVMRARRRKNMGVESNDSRVKIAKRKVREVRGSGTVWIELQV